MLLTCLNSVQTTAIEIVLVKIIRAGMVATNQNLILAAAGVALRYTALAALTPFKRLEATHEIHSIHTY